MLRAPCSDEGDRGCPGAGGAAQLRVSEDQGELADRVARELARVEVLDDEHAVVDVQRLRHIERPRRILGRHRSVAPRVAPREGDTVSRQVLSEVEPGSRFALEISVRVSPVRAVAGMEEDGVTRLEVDVLQGLDANNVA